jgi:alpha-beta hydrolase superfamily lysophospholipase
LSFYKVILIAIVVYILLNIILYFTQELFIFQSGKKLSKGFKFNFDFPYEEVYLNPEKEAILHGLLLKSKEPKGVILFYHGNRGNVTRWGNIVKYFLQFNYDILVMDYRGYGKSSGIRNETKLHSDALFAFKYLTKTYNKQNIIIYGRSIGTGVATKLASEVNPKCLILETPYKNFADLLNKRLFMFPIRWLINYDFRSDLFLKNVQSPVHIFHGTNDNIVPLESALRLVESTNRKDINVNIIDGGKHNNLDTFNSYYQEIELILND